MPCPSCLLDACEDPIREHRIRFSETRGYLFVGCQTEAARLQRQEDLRRKGVMADVVAGLRVSSGIPEKFKSAGFVGFRPMHGNKTAIIECQSFVKEFAERCKTGRGLMLRGGVGVGKTHLACASLKALIETGVESRYAYAPELLAMMRDRSKESTLLDMTYRELGSVKCLCIDDIGVDPETAWSVSVYTRIIDARYRNCRPTILITNLGLEVLESVVGVRSMSRIVESYTMVEINGDDERMR